MHKRNHTIETMFTHQPLSREKALAKLAALCARAEYCTGDMEDKMRRWGLSSNDIKENIAYLVGNKYIDNARYCKAFVNDKIAYNHWGRRKIEQALWMKRVPESVSAPILDAVPEENYISVLKPLLASKAATVKAESDYERQMKLMKFAMGRGFSIDEIKQCL
jgi:regulatory protein